MRTRTLSEMNDGTNDKTRPTTKSKKDGYTTTNAASCPAAVPSWFIEHLFTGRKGRRAWTRFPRRTLTLLFWGIYHPATYLPTCLPIIIIIRTFRYTRPQERVLLFILFLQPMYRQMNVRLGWICRSSEQPASQPASRPRTVMSNFLGWGGGFLLIVLETISELDS